MRGQWSMTPTSAYIISKRKAHGAQNLLNDLELDSKLQCIVWYCSGQTPPWLGEASTKILIKRKYLSYTEFISFPWVNWKHDSVQSCKASSALFSASSLLTMVSKVASMRQPLKLLLKVFSARARNRGSSYKGYKSINGGSKMICLSMNLLVFLGLDSFIPHLRWETVQHKVGDFALPSLSWIGLILCSLVGEDAHWGPLTKMENTQELLLFHALSWIGLNRDWYSTLGSTPQIVCMFLCQEILSFTFYTRPPSFAFYFIRDKIFRLYNTGSFRKSVKKKKCVKISIFTQI